MICHVCNKPTKSLKSDICRSCYLKTSPYFGHKREDNFNWKGGKQLHNGYVMVRFPEHPFAKGNGYVFEHRLVMEKHIGRYMFPHEFIHHINKVKTDNRIKNLKIVNNHYHPSLHVKSRKCSFCTRKHVARGYCQKHYWTHYLKEHKKRLS